MVTAAMAGRMMLESMSRRVLPAMRGDARTGSSVAPTKRRRSRERLLSKTVVVPPCRSLTGVLPRRASIQRFRKAATTMERRTVAVTTDTVIIAMRDRDIRDMIVVGSVVFCR